MAKKEHYPKDPDDLPLSTWAKGLDGTWRDADGNQTSLAELFGDGEDVDEMGVSQFKSKDEKKGPDYSIKPSGTDHYWSESERAWVKFGSYGGGYTTGTAYVACRHDPTAVVAHNPKNLNDGFSIWCASRSRSDISGLKLTDGSWVTADLAIGCDNNGWPLGRKHTIPKELPELAMEPVNAHIIKLDWPDRAAPPLPFNWWVRLWNLIEKNNWKVLLTCMGGHGRTGTALACIWAASGERDPIPRVRKHYCKEAIESKEQEAYIDKFIDWLDSQEEKKGKE